MLRSCLRGVMMRLATRRSQECQAWGWRKYRYADEYQLWNERTARKPIHDDCLEAGIFGSYSVLIGHVSMAGRGLGFLVVTWSTVVLLGGFVSDLEKKDFWSLTLITLVQITGVFNVSLKEKSSNALSLVFGIFGVSASYLPRRRKRHLLALRVFLKTASKPVSLSWIAAFILLAVVQLLVFCIILFPLGVLYMFGLPISAGISLWRLIQHDYGNMDGKANMKPALDVLYSLVLAQGIVFFYKIIIIVPEKRKAMQVSHFYRFDYQAYASVLDQFREIRLGCQKDPNFAKGRNLTTYAVALLQSELDASYLSGVRILGSLLKREIPKRSEDYITWVVRRRSLVHRLLIRQKLVGSASFGHIIHKLLRTLGPRSPYCKNIREHALRIVTHVADEIYLTQFPGGIESISSLLCTFEEYSQQETHEQDVYLPEIYQRDWLLEEYERDWLLERYEVHWLEKLYRSLFRKEIRRSTPPLKKQEMIQSASLLEGYKDVLMQGLFVLEKLAANEANCRVISEAEGLLSKIMAPVSTDLLHRLDHFDWRQVVAASLGVMYLLAHAPGEAGRKLRREISSKKKAISGLQGILMCGTCRNEWPSEIYVPAIKILIQLFGDDASSSMPTECREEIVGILLNIFDDEWVRPSSLRKVAGESLQMLSLKSKSNAMILLKVNSNVPHNLIKVLLDANESKTCRITAAQILENLCSYYTKDVNCLVQDMKQAITDALPKVLEVILSCKSGKTTSEGGIEEKWPNNTQVAGEKEQQSETADVIHVVVEDEIQEYTTETEDIEDQKRCWSSSSHGQEKGQLKVRKLQAALLFLSAKVFDKLIGEDRALAPEVDACLFDESFKEMVESNSEPTADCLRIRKSVTIMVISMLKHRSGGINSAEGQTLFHLIQSLGSVDNVANLDGATILFSDDDDDGSSYSRTLASLLNEANELLNEKRKEGAKTCN